MPKVNPKCPYFGVCGGCALQDVDYSEQVDGKLAAINQAFTDANLAIQVKEILRSPDQYYYRNRMDYPFGYQGELGLKVKGKWWKTLDLQTCFLLSEETPMILHRVREWTRASGLPFWNVKTHQGFFRYLVIREGKNTGERLIMLVVSDQAQMTDEQKQSFVALLDDVASSIIIGVNEKITDLSIPTSIEPIKGDPFLNEVVNDILYRIEPASFFQTNSKGAALLQDTVLEFCGEISGKRVLDLYCGAGFFTLALAKKADHVLGIEIDERAIVAAERNAELNSIKNARFIAAKTEEVDWAKERPEVIIIDPPRAGLHPSVIEALTLALPERIVYVSCKYQKLIEELPAFLKHYTVTNIRAIDLFPQTPHVELVVELTRI